MPWVFWYWDDAAVSEAGIRLDLEAMKRQGIGGAYLFFIRGASDPLKFDPPAVQLTDHWWDLVRFAFAEAKRLDIKLGLHACDGFTAAGGPWISPDKSMKKLVWSDTLVQGPITWAGILKQPETLEGFYRDIKTYAYRIDPRQTLSNYNLKPRITSSLPGLDLSWMNDPENTDGRFRSEDPCWFQFAFEKPFTCRSVTFKGMGNIFQANRLILETSDDGEHFTFHTRLEPHRQGWTDGQWDITHAVPPVIARFFRFRYDPGGTEPGAEDLDAAKWRQTLKIGGVELSSEAKIHQFEGKNGSVWRIAQPTGSELVGPGDCVRPEDLIDLTPKVSDTGELNWDVPPGEWRIRRIGFTSTGATNYIGGGAKGLECDKFDPAAATLQFNQWIGAFYDKIPEESIEKTLEIFHVDSWECGSQNWSDDFAEAFRQRRGYDLLPNLLVMTGVPVQSADFSEKVLLDVRETIGELVRDNFFGTFKKLAAERGLKFSAESIAPVMVGDGMLHHSIVDLPMGEFWYNSPTHDKPNDMLDAISGGHVYGKKIIQSESFTEIRLDWDEHPGKLKRVLDRNFALGVNRIVVHVFNHNPWVDRKPGMTLGVVGFFYQPAQTWFDTGGKAWMDYIRNCQQLLQRGDPVVDIAVFTGEEMPRRAVLPDRLVSVLPGIFGDSIVQKEKARLLNAGIPMQERPAGVRSVANIADPADWINPLAGYAYDSFNKDALLRLSRVQDGKIVLPGGAAYSLLVVPGARKMMPEGDRMSLEVARNILALVKGGATVYLQQKPVRLLGPAGEGEQVAFRQVIDTLFAGAGDELAVHAIGKGKVITGSFTAASFAPFGVEKDLTATDSNGQPIRDIAWNHRRDNDRDIYFISNPSDRSRTLNLSFRVRDKVPVIYYPDHNQYFACSTWQQNGDRVELPVQLHANESCFVLFGRPESEDSIVRQNPSEHTPLQTLDGPWEVQFDPAYGGPKEPREFKTLTDWTAHHLDGVKYYSGTAVYKKTFTWNGPKDRHARYYLSLGEVNNLARVKVNGALCGVAWTAPYRVDITDHLVKGNNRLEIAVSNTWANRLIGDHSLPEKDRVTWTTAAYRLEGRELLPAGLGGPVVIGEERDTR